MKQIIPSALLGALFAMGAVNAATTTPVGYITHTIYGNAANNPSGAVTYLSATLVQPTVFAGVSTVTPSGGSVITFSGNVPTDLDNTYVLEISAGDQEGWWSAVTSSTATTITVADAFPASLPADTKIAVRKFSTVKSLLGDNAPGLTPFDGGVTTADEVQFLDPNSGLVSTVSYLPESISGSPDEWFDFVNGVSANNYPIEPGAAIRIVRYGTEGSTFQSTGEVKTSKTQVDIVAAENWVSQPLGVGGSLGYMNFFPQLVAFDAGTTPNDFLEVLTEEQQAVSYVALSEDLGGGYMLDYVGGVDADNVVLPEGAGYIIRRDASQAPSVLTIPAVTIGNAP